MRVRDTQMSRTGLAGKQIVTRSYTVTQSKTNRPIVLARPGRPFELEDVRVTNEGYTATIGFDVRLCGLNEILSGAALAIHSTPEQFAVGAHVLRVGGKFVEKGAATALTFTAAHVVAASKFGAILVQESNAGAISTKVGEATQTTAMSYATAAEALAALPAADSGKVAIGHILIENNAGAWTANTDDLTDASDVTTATFTSYAVSALSCLTGAVAPVAFEVTSGVLHGTSSRWQDDGTKDIVLVTTTDGTAAGVNLTITVGYRGTGVSA